MRNIITGPNIIWVDIQDPQEEDVAYLRKTFKLREFTLEEVTPRAWRTKACVLSNHILLVLFYPLYNKETQGTKPRELNIIITKGALITIHYQSILPIKALFDSVNLYPENKEHYFGHSSEYLLYTLLDTMWKSITIKLERITKKLDVIEERIFKGRERQMLEQISLAKADIIDLWRVTWPQDQIIKVLKPGEVSFFATSIEQYYTELNASYTQAVNDLRTYKETIHSLEETNNALLTHKTNEIVQVLTLVSIIFLPLTVIASIFQMNTPGLPFSTSPHGFWIVIGIMAICTGAIIWFFQKKRWF